MAKLKGKYIEDDTIEEVKLDISNAPTDGYVLQYKDVTDKLTWVSPAAADAHDVKVSANDTTPGFLAGKLVEVSGKTFLTEIDDAGNETLSIGIGADIFDHTTDTSDDITEGSTKLLLTTAERTKLTNTTNTNSGDEVVAIGSEVDTGTDNVKMVTSLAIADSKLSYTDGSETLTNKEITSPTLNGGATLTADSTELNLLNGITSIETTLVGGATTLARSDAIKTYADNIIAAADAMTYKGATDCSTNPNYPAADAGETYKVSVAGKIGGASGINVEVGDMFICTTDSTPAGDQAAEGDNWNIIQGNLDGAVIGPTSAVTTNLATFDGTSGTLIADGGIAVANVFDTSSNDTDDITVGDAKFVTASDITNLGNLSGTNSGDEIVAIGSELNTGTDDVKYASALALANSKYITSDGTETLTNKTIDANGTGNSISNIDVADLANGTDGQLITWDAAGAPATVLTGTATHVLTSNGTGTAPTFQAPATQETRIVEIVTLDATDISNGYNDDLTQVPTSATAVELCPVGGIPQEYGVDYTIVTDTSDIKRINWNALALASLLASTDRLMITYTY
jgi:hypothetical protein